MNNAIILGRLTRDPELRYTSSNVAVANLSVAVNRNYTNEEGEKETDYINVTVFKKQAENCKNYLSKGSQIAIKGEIRTDTYTDKDGNNKRNFYVLANQITFLDTKKKDTKEPKKDYTKVYEEFGEQIEIDESEMPF